MKKVTVEKRKYNTDKTILVQIDTDSSTLANNVILYTLKPDEKNKTLMTSDKYVAFKTQFTDKHELEKIVRSVIKSVRELKL